MSPQKQLKKRKKTSKSKDVEVVNVSDVLKININVDNISDMAATVTKKAIQSLFKEKKKNDEA